ncbi:MAG: hypothetical protein ACFFD4_23690, partial [Candidatus Odinarchaeota archaeon]
ELTTTVPPSMQDSSGEQSTEETSAPAGTDGKKIEVWIDQPYDVFVGQDVQLHVMFENYETFSVPVNVTVMINGEVEWTTTNMMLAAGVKTSQPVAMNTSVAGDYEVYLEVENDGNFYWDDCWYYVHDRDQLLVWIDHPPDVVVNKEFKVKIRVWNLYTVPVYLVNVSLIIGSDLYYENLDGITIPALDASGFYPPPESFFDVFVEIETEGYYDVWVYVETASHGTYMVDGGFEAWSEHYSDYYIWIDQEFIYPVNVTFYIYLEIQSSIDKAQNVTVHAEVSGLPVYDGIIWVEAYGMINIPLPLYYSMPGYYEIKTWVGDESGFIYSDDWCWFEVVDFSDTDYYLYIEQDYEYEAYKKFEIALHVASYTDADRDVNITVEINGEVVFHEENYWLANESYEVFWITLYDYLPGEYDVYAYLETNDLIYAEAWCWFRVFEPAWFDLWIEQDWAYEIYTWFEIWVGIDSYADFGQNVHLVVEVTHEDGHIEVVWQDDLWIDPYGYKDVPVKLYFDKHGHYKIHAYIKYDLDGKNYYYDTWCDFEIIDKISDYWIWIEQDYFYTVDEPFSIFIHIDSYHDISQNVSLQVKLNGILVYSKEIWVEAYKLDIIVQVSLNISVINYYDVHAVLLNVYTGAFYADAWCGFKVREYADFYIYIDQRDKYWAFEEFSITAWIKSNLDYAKVVNITVIVGGNVVFYKENALIDPHAIIEFKVQLSFEIATGYDVHVKLDVNEKIFENFCHFEIVWLEIWIEQEDYYLLSEKFTIQIHLKASYETEVRVKVEIGGNYYEFHKHLYQLTELTIPISLSFTYPGWKNVYAHVEEEPFSGIWKDAWCGFEIIRETQDFSISIDQQLVYFRNTSFSVIVWIFSNIDDGKTGTLTIRVDELDNVWTGDVFVKGQGNASITIDFGPSNFTLGGYHEIYALFKVGTDQYEGRCVFHLIFEDESYAVFIRKDDPRREVGEEFDVVIAVACNPSLTRAVNATLKIQIGDNYYDKGPLILEPGCYMEFSFTAKFNSPGGGKVHAKLELESGRVYEDYFEFDIVEPETTDTTTTSKSSSPPVFSPGFDLVTLVVALLSFTAVPVYLNRRKKI